MNAPIRDAFHCSSRKPIRSHFVSGFPRALLSLSHAQKRRALAHMRTCMYSHPLSRLSSFTLNYNSIMALACEISLVLVLGIELCFLPITTILPSSAICLSQSRNPPPCSSGVLLYLSAQRNKSRSVMKPCLPANTLVLLRRAYEKEDTINESVEINIIVGYIITIRLHKPFDWPIYGAVFYRTNYQI